MDSMPNPPRQPLILASQSPRRKQLLQDAGYRFEVIVPLESAECGLCSQETAPQMVARLAYQKAKDVVDRLAPNQTNQIVVACDTLAECQGQILGKPRDPDHAIQMLKLLRGRTHHVYSGLCLWHPSTQKRDIQVACSRLQMEFLSDPQIDEYIRSDAWIDKAGAFGYQDRTGWLTLLEGSESNVVGLPMELLREMLHTLGA